MLHSVFLILAVLQTAPVAASASYVWWEAEQPVSSVNLQVHRDPPNSNYGRVLSEGGRVEARNPDGEKMRASYRVELSESGTFHLWVRKFWRHGPFKWRFGETEWRTCERDFPLHFGTNIQINTNTNWVYLGELELEAGELRFEVESLDNKGFLDCFLLIDGPFVPAGKLKPGERSHAAAEGWFAWEPGADAFEESPIDLRYLNEPYAGAHGYIRREGNRFVRGDGQSIRFWMTQCGNIMPMQPYMRDQHTRRLAKYGVNLARFVMLDTFKTWRSGDEEEFARKLDQLHQTVASCKRNGIYVYLGHLFWDTHVESLADDELPGLKKGEKATCAMFFNEPLQDYYLRWVRDLMTPVNPYTGLSLAEDPAVAVIEVQNESNTLFWTLNPERLAPHTLDLMERAFGAYAIRKYGSLELALAKWGQTVAGDEVNAGRAGILGAWSLTTKGPAEMKARAADQIQFLTERQYALYGGMKEAFWEMGIRKMVAGSNWKTADPSNLGPLEHYSYTAVDMVNKNEYFAPVKLTNPRFYNVDVGDEFVPLSAMRAPEMAGVLMVSQQADWPYLITENNWEEPNVYRAEWPFLVATYGSATGVDAWNFFAYDTPFWYTGGNTWSVNTPEVLGQFPAYALMYRRGDVVEGPPAVVEDVPFERLYGRQSVALPEIQYKDEVWKRTLGGDPSVDFRSAIDPKAFFAGPSILNLGTAAHRLETADLESLVDTQNRVIYNTNGQLEWRYGDGFITVETALSQGACGYLGEVGVVELADVSIEMVNEYGTVIVVALDNEPLPSSERILVQACTMDRPYGFELTDMGEGGRRIESVGGYPLNVERIRGTVRLRGKASYRVTVLDELGYPTGKTVHAQRLGDDLVFELPEDALYTVVER